MSIFVVSRHRACNWGPQQREQSIANCSREGQRMRWSIQLAALSGLLVAIAGFSTSSAEAQDYEPPVCHSPSVSDDVKQKCLLADWTCETKLQLLRNTDQYAPSVAKCISDTLHGDRTEPSGSAGSRSRHSDLLIRCTRAKGNDTQIEACSEAIEADTDSYNHGYAYGLRGGAYLDARKLSAAIDDFNHALALLHDNDDVVSVLKQRAVAYYRLNQYGNAEADFSRAIDLETNSGKPDKEFLYGCYLNRGIAYGDDRKYDLAISDFSEAIALEPDNFDTYDARAYTFLMMKNFDRALDDYAVYLKHNPRDVQALKLRAQLELNLGKARHSDALVMAGQRDFAALKTINAAQAR